MTKQELIKQLSSKLLKLKLLKAETSYRSDFYNLDATINDYKVIINNLKNGKCNTILDINKISRYNYPKYFKLSFKTDVMNKSLRDIAMYGNNNSFDSIIGLEPVIVTLMERHICHDVEV